MNHYQMPSSTRSSRPGRRFVVALHLLACATLLAIVASTSTASAQAPVPGVGSEINRLFGCGNAGIQGQVRCYPVGSDMVVYVSQFDSASRKNQTIHTTQLVSYERPTQGNAPRGVPAPGTSFGQVMHDCGWLAANQRMPGHGSARRLRKYCYSKSISTGTLYPANDQISSQRYQDIDPSPQRRIKLTLQISLFWDDACWALVNIRTLNPSVVVPPDCAAHASFLYAPTRWNVKFTAGSNTVNSGLDDSKAAGSTSQLYGAVPRMYEERQGYYTADARAGNNLDAQWWGDSSGYDHFFYILPDGHTLQRYWPGTTLDTNTMQWISDAVEEPNPSRVDVWHSGMPPETEWQICSGSVSDPAKTVCKTPSPVPSPTATPASSCTVCSLPVNSQWRGLDPQRIPYVVDGTMLNQLDPTQRTLWKSALNDAVKEWNYHSPVRLFQTPRYDLDSNIVHPGEIQIEWRPYDIPCNPANGSNDHVSSMVLSDSYCTGRKVVEAAQISFAYQHRLGLTERPCEEPWTYFYLRSVMLHELGHTVFGGGHVGDVDPSMCRGEQQSVMCGGVDDIDHLLQADIDGLQCLYGHLP